MPSRRNRQHFSSGVWNLNNWVFATLLPAASAVRTTPRCIHRVSDLQKVGYLIVGVIVMWMIQQLSFVLSFLLTSLTTTERNSYSSSLMLILD